MSEKTLLLILTMMLFAAGLHAIPQQEARKTIASNASERAAENIARAPNTGQKEHLQLQRRNPLYRISRGDILKVDFPLTPEFNETVTVLPDGYVSLRGVGNLHAEGQTVPELTHSLRQVYAKILRDPILTVALKDFEKPYFIVDGEVGHPGKFDLRGDTTVLQAVAIAGGFTEKAKHSQVLLFRRASNDWVEVKKLNLKEMQRGSDLNEDPHLRPGDMLFVPKNAISKIKGIIPATGMGIYYNPGQY